MVLFLCEGSLKSVPSYRNCKSDILIYKCNHFEIWEDYCRRPYLLMTQYSDCQDPLLFGCDGIQYVPVPDEFFMEACQLSSGTLEH